MSALNREAWLVSAVEALTPLFSAIGEAVPAVRVSVGWPGGRGKKSNVIGQCWTSASSADGVAQLFISPAIGDAETVLATLAHEIVHAVDDCKSGHRGRFTKVAKALGLTGPMTATTAGPDLAAALAEISEGLGEYPHAILSPSSAIKKQGTRMLKVVCPADGYTLRTTAKWIAVGLPSCPCGEEMLAESA